MWTQYRRTLIPTQLAILLACIGLIAFVKVPVASVGVFFLTTQAGAILGAWWGVRLKRKIEEKRMRLPLTGRT